MKGGWALPSEEFGSYVRRAGTPATQVFWIILFIDIAWLFFQYGGLAVTDILVHCFFLFAATLALFWERQVYQISKLWLCWLGIPLLIGLVQLISVSPEALASLNPVKHRILGEVLGIQPNLELSSEITMMPVLHRFRLGLLVLDVYLILLLLMARRPSRRLISWFLHLLAGGMAFLNILASSDRLMDLPLLSRFEGTYGGLVNPNHFATLSAVWMVYLIGFLFIRMKKASGLLGDPSKRQAAFEGLGSAALTVLVLGLTLISFRSVYSRSGLVTLFLMLAVLASFGLWNLFSGVNKRLRLGICGAVILGVLLFFPLGRGIDKFAEKALDNLRVTQFHIGMDYLTEKPLLGVGLGSTKSILHPVVPRETVYDLRLSTDFHNEYLQVAVEYGPLGLLVLVVFLGWLLWQLFPRERTGSFSNKMFLVMAWCMIAGFSFHSLFSFPMRVTSIRIFVLVMVGFALKFSHHPTKRDTPRWRLIVMLLLLVITAATFAFRHFPASKYGELKPDSLAYKAYRYGDYHQMLKYQANDQLEATLAYLGELDGLKTHMDKTRALFNEYLHQQPFSIQALNGLFMLDMIDYRLNETAFNPAQFERWQLQADAINHLGRDSNINARLAKFFLYANYLEHLSEDQMTYYEEMKEQLAFRFRDAEAKASDIEADN